MSLFIDVDTITHVLLGNEWHEVHDGSFSVDAYELMWSGQNGKTIEQAEADDPASEPLLVHGGGTGFSFRTKRGSEIAGPITSVVAVRYGKDQPARVTVH